MATQLTQMATNTFVGMPVRAFPVTNALQPTFKAGSGDGFVAKLNSDWLSSAGVLHFMTGEPR